MGAPTTARREALHRKWELIRCFARTTHACFRSESEYSVPPFRRPRALTRSKQGTDCRVDAAIRGSVSEHRVVSSAIRVAVGERSSGELHWCTATRRPRVQRCTLVPAFCRSAPLTHSGRHRDAPLDQELAPLRADELDVLRRLAVAVGAARHSVHNGMRRSLLSPPSRRRGAQELPCVPPHVA